MVILAAINHTNEQWAYARKHRPVGQFDLVWVKTDIDFCMARDPKMLYSHAKQILVESAAPEVVGIDIFSKEPTDIDLTVTTFDLTPDERIIDCLIDIGTIETIGEA